MKCECLGDIEKKLAEKYTAELGVNASVECQAIGFTLIENSFDLAHRTDFKITAPIKGYIKGKTMPVFANYCPFCGKSVKDNAATKATAPIKWHPHTEHPVVENVPVSVLIAYPADSDDDGDRAVLAGGPFVFSNGIFLDEELDDPPVMERFFWAYEEDVVAGVPK